MRARDVIATAKRRAALLLALMTAVPLMAHAADERQYKLEAAFIYNFFNYVTWPGYDSPSDLKDVTICVSSRDPILPYLDYVKERMSSERTISIREWQDGRSLDGCHIWFTRNGRAQADDRKTLTVSNNAQFLSHGGMIAISESGGRMGVRINNNVMNKNGFQASSRLLSIAQEVK